MAATLHGRVRVVRVLLEHSADINKCCFDGSTAAEIAITQGHTKVRYCPQSGTAASKLLIIVATLKELELQY